MPQPLGYQDDLLRHRREKCSGSHIQFTHRRSIPSSRCRHNSHTRSLVCCRTLRVQGKSAHIAQLPQDLSISSSDYQAMMCVTRGGVPASPPVCSIPKVGSLSTVKNLRGVCSSSSVPSLSCSSFLPALQTPGLSPNIQKQQQPYISCLTSCYNWMRSNPDAKSHILYHSHASLIKP